MAVAMLNLRAQIAGNALACSNIVRDLSQNSQKRDVEAACRLQLQTAPKQLHSLKSSSLRSTSYKQDSSRKRSSCSRITTVLEAQARGTASTDGEIIKNPAEALMEHFGNLPSSDITHSSVTESADRLFLWESIPKLAEAQTFSVYELNEFDRDSPAFLEFSRQTVNKVDPDTGAHVHALGDQVAFTNKLYDGSLKLRLGITAGICLLMKHYPGMGTPEMKRQQFFFPDRYETLMTWYFGDFGHISGQGPFVNYQDTLMSITGGVGFFREARGVVRLNNISPFKFFYTFTLTGIPELPKHLTASVVPPSESAAAIPEAVACDPLFTLPNFSK